MAFGIKHGKHLILNAFFIYLFTIFSSCLSYYEKNIRFNSAFESGNLNQAQKELENQKKRLYKKSLFLRYVNFGTLLALQGNYTESNKYFEQAYLFSEDFLVNYFEKGFTYLTNPMKEQYRPEDHEILLVNYFKAVNQLKIGDNESALIECRRLNKHLNVLSSKYGGSNTYKRDAFSNLIMAIAFENAGEFNNAYIFYKNAYTIYEEDFSSLFGVSSPQQLKKDLLRAANKAGFIAEQQDWERKFGFKLEASNENNGDVVIIWNNGLTPIKEQHYISLALEKGVGGRIFFTNREYGYSFPFYNETFSNSNSGSLSNLNFISVALPYYQTRRKSFSVGNIVVNGERKPLEKVHDIDKLARKCLKDRLLVEMAKAISRMAIKQAAAKASKYITQEAIKSTKKSTNSADQNNKVDANAQAIGSLVSMIVNIATTASEKAETRHWQTLPSEIGYTRISLPPGKQQIELETRNSVTGELTSRTLSFNIIPGQTIFHTVTTF